MADEWAQNENPVASAKLNRLNITQLSTTERDAKDEADLQVGQIIYNTTTAKYQKLVSKGPATWEDLKVENDHTHDHTEITDFDTGVQQNRLDQMAAPTAAVSMNNQKFTNLADGTAATDAATKGQVDQAKAGLDVKDSVRVASTANIDLTSATDPNPVDGVTLADGDRILLKNQTDATENGIYVANTAIDPTTWARATDADEDSEVTSGMFTFVEEGTTHANEGWALTTDDPITLGTTSLSFSKFTGVDHNLLSNTHSDSVTAAVARGSIIVGNSTPKWSALALGASGTYLRSDGTDLVYAAIVAGDLPASVLLNTQDNDLGDHFYDLGNIAVPATPGAGKFRVFVDDGDNVIKIKKPDGTVVSLEEGATGGEANTASNVGTGIGVFKEKVSADLKFRSILGLNGIVSQLSGDDDEVEIKLTGLQDIWAMSGAFVIPSGGTAEFATRDTSTNAIPIAAMKLDPDTAEKIYLLWTPPRNWDAGTIKVRLYWTATGGTGGNSAKFGISGRAYADDETLDAAPGTAQTITDALLANDDLHVTAFTSAITLAGTPAAGQLVIIEIERLAGDAADDLTVDAEVLGATIEYTISKAAAA